MPTEQLFARDAVPFRIPCQFEIWGLVLGAAGEHFPLWALVLWIRSRSVASLPSSWPLNYSSFRVARYGGCQTKLCWQQWSATACSDFALQGVLSSVGFNAWCWSAISPGSPGCVCFGYGVEGLAVIAKFGSHDFFAALLSVIV